MRITLVTILMSTVMTTLSAQQWDGQYQGNIEGTPATLDIQTSGETLNAVIDAQGYRYNLQGTMQGNSANGKLTDPQTQATMDFTAENSQGSVLLTLIAVDPYSGQQQRFPLTFRRNAQNAPIGQAPMTGSGSQTENQNGAVEERDQRLVGLWSYTESYSSGEYSFASQFKLQINPDGTYLYGDGKVAGGGPGVSGSSGSGGDVTQGKWKTEGNII
jgi:hypothetical protein